MDPRPPVEVALRPLPRPPTWDFYVDRSLNEGGSEAGLVLLPLEPERLRIEYTLRFDFKASNNDAKYEALLVWLRLARVVGIKHLNIFSDSQLVVSQEYQAKGKWMMAYLS